MIVTYQGIKYFVKPKSCKHNADERLARKVLRQVLNGYTLDTFVLCIFLKQVVNKRVIGAPATGIFIRIYIFCSALDILHTARRRNHKDLIANGESITWENF